VLNIGPFQHAVVLTGAGISAESGVPTFRDAGGLWEGHPVEDVATPEAFARDPAGVWAFYGMLREKCRGLPPNAAHVALAELERRLPTGSFTLVTQNVDPLHSRAGSRNVLYMHGELGRDCCTHCAFEKETWEIHSAMPVCPQCSSILRPKITWFGEIPYCMEEIESAMVECDLFIVIGTSGVVYPAAGLVQMARAVGARTICINKEPPANVDLFDDYRRGEAGTLVPELVAELAAGV
jgi:NAD-dependent deacetylase